MHSVIPHCAQCEREIKASEPWVKLSPQADGSAEKVGKPIYLHLTSCLDAYLALCSQEKPEKENHDVQKG